MGACVPAVATEAAAAGHRSAFLGYLGARQQIIAMTFIPALLRRARDYDTRLVTDSGPSLPWHAELPTRACPGLTRWW